MQFTPDPQSHIPLYKQLELHFVAEIRKGAFEAGAPLPSIAQLERSLPSLGRVTIVRALQELAGEGFVTPVHGKGFYVTQMGGTALVGLVAPLHSGYMEIYVKLLSGLSAEAAKRGHRVLAASSDESPRKFIDSVDELVKTRGSKWLVLVPPAGKGGKADKECVAKIESLVESGRAKVAVVDRETPRLQCVQIAQDRQGIVNLVLERAARHGCKRILFVGAGLSGFPGLDSLNENAGVSVRSIKSQGPEKDLRAALKEPCDLLVCGNDALARGVLDLAEGPLPFKLCGVNGTASATAMLPRVSTVDTGLAEAGRLAFKLLSDEVPHLPGEKMTASPFLVEGDTF